MTESWIQRARILVEIAGPRLAVDVALIGLALWGLIRILRATGTWKVVAGLLVAAAVLAAADLLRLEGTRWVYDQFSSVVLFGLVVVFQPEIRKVLEKTATLRRRESVDQGLAPLLGEALFDLARRRWGAIVVVPGADPIDRFVSGGVEAGAAPSLPLLLSIFDPHSPGHDGAAILEHGRIGRIGVRLPLGESEETAHLGTRHHAALGLSQSADVLAFAVSEERGTVTVFSQGRVAEARGPRDVEAHLVAHRRRVGGSVFGEAEGRGWGTEAAVLAGCLVVALAVSTRATLERTEVVERSLEVPVEFVTPRDLSLVGEKPAALTVYLAGTATDLEEVDPDRAKAKIDMTRARPGRQDVVVTEEAFDLPRGVTLLEVDPPRFEVTLAEVEWRDVPLRVPLVGDTPAHVRIERVEVSPETVRVRARGGADGESAVVFLSTEPVYLEEITGTTRLSVKIVAPPTVVPSGGRWPDAEVRIVVR